MDEQQKLVKKSLEIQVEEKHVAEIKNKVQTVRNSLEETNSSIKQTQMTSVNGYRGDECQNQAYAEKTKSSESKRILRVVRNLKLTEEPGEEQNTETRMRRTRRRSKSRRIRRRSASTVRQVYVEAHHEEVPVNFVDPETSGGTQNSSRRSSRTTPARLHRACTVERLHTNIEELTKHNTADLFTKHLERSRSQGNLDHKSWMVRKVTTENKILASSNVPWAPLPSLDKVLDQQGDFHSMFKVSLESY